MTAQNLRIASAADVARRLQPVVVGGDILAYSYVRELHRAYGVERTIVLATQDIKMLSSSRFTDYRLEPLIHEPEGLYDALERVAAQVRAEDPDRVLLVLGCDDCHARMLSSGKPRLEAAGYAVPYIDFDLLDDITQKRRFYELCDELDIPYPRTWYFDCSENGPAELPVQDFPYPLIAKPSNSAQFQDADIPRKRKIYEIESAEELAQVWRDIRTSDYDNELVLQDFIPGGDDASARSPRSRTPRARCAWCRAASYACRTTTHSTRQARCASWASASPRSSRAPSVFLKRTGYRGFANFDIKLDERDGSFPLLRGEHALRPQHVLHEPGRPELRRAHRARVPAGRDHRLPRGVRSVRLQLRATLRAGSQHGEPRAPAAGPRDAAPHPRALPVALRARLVHAQRLGEGDAREPDPQVQALLLGHRRQAAEVANSP